MVDIANANEALKDSAPQQIVEWAINNGNKPIVTTNFGPHEAVILHMATQVKSDIKVIWIDSGYNTRDTYKVAEQLIESLKLNIEVYTPKVSAARRDAALGGIPGVDDPGHAEFTEQFKLEPFSRAMKEEAPDIWLTAVRREQTAFRQDMDIVDTGPNGVIKVAPLLDWKTTDMDNYLKENNLPNVEKYFDPTKAISNRECGLHTKL
ncbi:MAG: phosphoadenosine phosphosulfate reductase family protein [Cellvibrionaceae bacterium]